MDKERTAEDVLTRLRESLLAGVLPHIANHYAQLQLRAACEMLSHVGARTRWNDEIMVSHNDALRQAVDTLAIIGGDGARPAGETGQHSIQELRESFAKLIGSVYDSSTAPAEGKIGLDAAWLAIRAEFNTNAAHLRTGMHA